VEEHKNKKDKMINTKIYLLQNTKGLFRPVMQDQDGNVEAVGDWVKQKSTAMNKIKKIEESGKAKFFEEESLLQETESKPEQKKLFEVDEVDYLTTKNGYPFDEVASALQKEIRRGNEEEAYFWAKELEERYYKYCWKRLTIIASEDIGMANPDAVIFINALRTNYFYLRDNSKKELPVDYNIIAHAVSYLCRSPKSREMDHFLQVVEHDDRGDNGWLPFNHKDVPDYALDKHTQRGRSKKRKWEHFIYEASHINNELGTDKYKPEMERIIASRNRVSAQGKGAGITKSEWESMSVEQQNEWIDRSQNPNQ